ncbi:hypothetical protein PUN28_011848 [Cardiocondyla obscurior]|uniref:Uncharacterized protein n=1 Tax=Cardiocondyla obscurior TaxID=286306 RepID=A0AAW2FKY0_9HYME
MKTSRGGQIMEHVFFFIFIYINILRQTTTKMPLLRSIRNANLESRVLGGDGVRSTPRASRAELFRSKREDRERQEFLAETKIASPRGSCSGIGCSLESERIRTVPLNPDIDFLYVKSDDAGLPGLSGARDVSRRVAPRPRKAARSETTGLDVDGAVRRCSGYLG